MYIVVKYISYTCICIDYLKKNVILSFGKKMHV